MGSIISAEKSAAVKTGCAVEVWRQKRKSGLLWCSRCKCWKERNVFTSDRSRGSGKATSCQPCMRIIALRSRYKLSEEEYSDLVSKNDGACEICDRSDVKMEVDHNHETGKVRSFLCSRCNGALGQFCDDINLLKTAIKYLEKHNG